ncbi:MAG: replicative DNA helicase [Ignavibacteriaceae bacterium]|nr:MAG: replicative DNA helicase [Ignavibacteriaceae bacterium]MBW7874198.1 replicative DNA helicase [Ignavibacteria bacterium]OQY74844.1 MAG: replicative DNA helicase [Ignavibacteriales bacterium UTCHB3]
MVPPHTNEIETLVLGAMLIDPEAINKAVSVIDKTAFYKPAHQTIFAAMVNLYNEHEPIDVPTVFNELSRLKVIDSVGGLTYLSELGNNISSAANIEYHLKILVEKKILRDLINVSHRIAQRAYMAEDTALKILDEAENSIFQISETRSKKTYIDMKRAVTQTIEYIEVVHNKTAAGVVGVPTGFYDLDDFLGGFQNSDLIILAARPSMGKTALALAFARNAAVMHKLPVAIFSLEMATTQLVTRLICSEAKIPGQNLRKGRMTAEEHSRIAQYGGKLAEAPIYIDDVPGQTVLEIRAKSRRLKSEYGIKMIVIDYLQLMQGHADTESREREISTISRSLKGLAKDLDIPIIALSQLNRESEKRTDKRPMLSDLRESGSIEQDADVVMFIHRPEYYGKEVDSEGNSMKGLAEVIIAKHRNGPTGEVKLTFLHEYTKFENRQHFNRFAGEVPQF